ncbi:extracellular mutant protein 11-domain-containing protein [Phyllosticta capitalensis]|uniref:extracellular mutant protein 11-domain-containing protein n=1 Tax=Phyllosticta capitalensis TaxID=121624 RepID=UPI003131CEB4
MKNFAHRRKEMSPVRQNAGTPTESNQGRLLRAQAAKMTPPPTKLSHGEVNMEDNCSLGDSSVGAPTLKENAPPRQPVRDTFETDDEHADLTTTTGSFGHENHYESNGAYPLSEHHDRFQDQNFGYDDDEQPQVDDEEAHPHFHRGSGQFHFGSDYQQQGTEFMSRLGNLRNDMYQARKDTDSFPATTNGEMSEPEFDDEGISHRGQEYHQQQPFDIDHPPNQSTFERTLPQRPASPSRQNLNQPAPQDPFNSVRRQAPTRAAVKPNMKMPPPRATQNGSPRPKSMLATSHELQQHTPVEPTRQPTPPPTYNSKSKLPVPTGFHSPDRSIADAINARSDRTLSHVDAQTLSSSSESELPLDYDEEQLKNMSFEDLANESFDYNPRLDPKSVPLHDSTAPLAERCQQMAHHTPAEQAAFFAAMPIEEWDEAGAWFIEQFGTVMRRFTEARREKRRAAQDYEAEVATRHGEVARKKRRIEDEIESMKGKGKDLLPKTPSKSRAGSVMR